MTTAQSVWARVVAAVATPPVRRALIVGCVVVVSLAGAYCAGQRHQADVDAHTAYSAKQQGLVKTINVLEKVIEHDTVRVAATRTVTRSADSAAFRADSTFRAHVRVLSDTTVSIDGAPPVSAIPVALALPGIQLCPSAVIADTAAYHALQVAFAHQVELTADEHAARLNAENEVKRIKGPKLGFKSGLVAGLFGAAALVWIF